MKLSRAQLLLCSGALLLSIVSATHFRYGLITYDQVNPSTNGVDFYIYNQQAWRWSAYGNPAVNSTLYLDATLTFSGGGPSSFNPLFTVNANNAANDWFIAVTGANKVSFTAVTSTTVGSNYIISAASCCRISSLQNNHDGNWRHTASVYVIKSGSFKSIKASVVPITTLIVNRQSTFSVNLITYNSEKLSYRLATAIEAGQCNGCWVAPTGLTIDYLSGVISWKPTVTGLYTVQIIIKGNTANATSATDVSTFQSYIALDWILQVIDTTSLVCKRFCSNGGSYCSTSNNCYGCDESKTSRTPKTPYCDTNTPPYFKSVRWGTNNKTVTRDVDNSVSITAVYQTKLTVYVDVVDDDIEDYITVGTAAIPSGVAITQTSTVEGSNTATLTWTPGDNDLSGAVICFTATDSLGYNTVGQLCLIITVGEGELSASGAGLTYSIAGANTTFFVYNSASRTHTLSFQGVGATYSGTVSDLGYTVVNTQGTQEVYQGKYNLTASGLYVLTVADSTSSLSIKPKSVVSILTVDPNVTYPASCVLFEQGSTGLTGGLVNSQVTFYVRAFDQFGNAQSLKRTDSFFFSLSYYASSGSLVSTNVSMTWDPSTAGGSTDYRYNGTYTIPSLAVGNTTYTLNVYYKSSSNATPYLVGTKTPSVVTTGFTCTFSFGSFVAGKAVSFDFSTSLSTTDASSKAFTASMNGIAATVTYKSSSTFTFTAPALTFTATGNYPKGIVLSAAGLGTSTGTTSSGTGTIYVDFDVINDVPAATYSFVSAKDSQNINSLNVNELSASEDPATIVISLRDAYNNPCSVGDFSVSYSAVNSLGVTKTGTATQSTVRELFYFYYTPNVAGSFSITSTVYITADSSSFDLNVISGKIVPGVFSNSQSSYAPVSSSDRDTVAGFSKTLLVTARDYLGNSRTEDPDLFNGTMTRAKYGTTPALTTILLYQQLGQLTQDGTTQFGTSDQYQFSYGSNTSGSYSIQVDVSVTSTDATGVKSSAFVNFANLPFTMWAGKLYQSKITAVDADNVKYNTKAEIVIQSQDAYGNTIEDLSGGRYIDTSDSTVHKYSNVTQAYIVEVSSTNKMIWTLYMAGYCPKTGTKPSKCPTSYLESSTDEKADEDSDDSWVNGVKYRTLSATDQTLYSDGFFRVYYRVPKALFYTNYTVNVYLLNTQQCGNSTWRSRVNDSSTILVKSFVFNVIASSEADNQTQTLSVAVVIGAAAGCFFVSGVGYGAFRLSRYRPKYKEAKKIADENEQILEEMRDEGNLAGGRDYMAVGGAVVTMNPLHVTFKTENDKRAEFIQQQNPALEIGEAPDRPSGI